MVNTRQSELKSQLIFLNHQCLDTKGFLFQFWLKITLIFENVIFDLTLMSWHNGVTFSVLMETNFEIYVFEIWFRYVIEDEQTAFLIRIINIGKTVKVGNLSTFSKILLSTLNNQNQRVSLFFKIVNVSTQWGYFFRSDWKYSVRD